MSMMVLKNSGFVGMAAACAALAGAAMFVIYFGGEDAPDVSEAVVVPAISSPIAQTYSAYCQTPQGVCVLPSAEPIGSTCQCDGTPGRVIP